MKIVLEQNEFEKMAAAWVYEHLVEKQFYAATIVGDAVELEVFGDGDAPPAEVSETVIESMESASATALDANGYAQDVV